MSRFQRLGWYTLGLQHGLDVPKNAAFLSEHIGCWNEVSATDLAAQSRHYENRVVLSGNPKYLDLPVSPLDRSQRRQLLSRFLGNWVSGFEETILLATNRNVYSGWRTPPAERAVEIIECLDANPDKLFILKPHMDDLRPYCSSDIICRDNAVLLDDTMLLILDLPVLRLLSVVDKCVTSPSTLAADACAAGTTAIIAASRDQDISPSLAGKKRLVWQPALELNSNASAFFTTVSSIGAEKETQSRLPNTEEMAKITELCDSGSEHFTRKLNDDYNEFIAQN